MVNFYKTLKRNFQELKDEIDCTLHSEFQHNQAHEIYNNPLSHTDVLRAWAVWMLSKQSIYSILTNSWSVSIDKNKAKQVQWSKEQFTILYARRLEHTSIFCRDAISVIESTDTPTTFHYCDPPYYNAEMGHYSGYKVDDFKCLLNTLAKVRGKFLLSSYPSEILADYVNAQGWKYREIDMHRSSGAGRKVETFTWNYDENIPCQRELF